MQSTLIRSVAEILLVEDNPGDIRLIQEAFKESSVPNHLQAVTDGEEALSYLFAKGPYADRPLPDLIFLDLNLPKKGGHEVLARIKRHKLLRRIPVVVLSGSAAAEDILKSYQLHANCYITKPVRLDDFMKMMDFIKNFWFGIARLCPQ